MRGGTPHREQERRRLPAARRQRAVDVPEWVRGGRRRTKEEDGGRDAEGAGLRRAL